MNQIDQQIIRGLVDLPRAQVILLLETGYLYMELKKPREAEQVFEGVRALIPHSAIPVMALGNLHFAEGKFERALRAHSEAASLEPANALLRAHVAEDYLFLGKKQEAFEALRQALDLESEGPAADFVHCLKEAVELEILPPRRN